VGKVTELGQFLSIGIDHGSMVANAASRAVAR